MDEPIHLRAWVDGDVGRRADVVCELGAAAEVTARGEVVAAEVTGHYG